MTAANLFIRSARAVADELAAVTERHLTDVRDIETSADLTAEAKGNGVRDARDAHRARTAELLAQGRQDVADGLTRTAEAVTALTATPEVRAAGDRMVTAVVAGATDPVDLVAAFVADGDWLSLLGLRSVASLVAVRTVRSARDVDPAATPDELHGHAHTRLADGLRELIDRELTALPAAPTEVRSTLAEVAELHALEQRLEATAVHALAPSGRNRLAAAYEATTTA